MNLSYLVSIDHEKIILSSHFIDLNYDDIDLGSLIDLEFFLYNGGYKNRRFFKGHELKQEIESKIIYKQTVTIEAVK